MTQSKQCEWLVDLEIGNVKSNYLSSWVLVDPFFWSTRNDNFNILGILFSNGHQINICGNVNRTHLHHQLILYQRLSENLVKGFLEYTVHTMKVFWATCTYNWNLSTSISSLKMLSCAFCLSILEGADKVRGRGEKRGREGGEEGEGGGRRGAGGGRRGGGRREKRGREEGEGRGKEEKFARAAPEGKRETRGREGEVRGREGERPTPCPPPHIMELRFES